MKRRKFMFSAMAAGTLPLTGLANQPLPAAKEKELYEIRTYEMKFGADQKVLLSYLNEVLAPSMIRMGATTFKLFRELGNSGPTKIYGLIAYPNSEVYLRSQNLNSDEKYVTAAAEYNSLPPEKTLYNRFTSSLLLAFDGMPQMMDPIDGASLFELRTYEGYSEDAVRRKIKMFNDGEIDIFLKTGLHPVFFGEMIVGPYRPCLTYMLNFKDMDEHDANWKRFSSNSDWETMKVKEEYANTVSNIRKIFLTPL
ncbi:NIPSNAP family protein [uncultured Kriegella sp.]|uniref:NIPSNAP family protein n=1 Tax=uncultured Kriegella sp. TaxID=1798910 RepID=UPI0030D87004|tara:strand:- start:149887 stop:150645 length:759 start_codon:yes stop_codon:yes gene_type:complete